MRTSLCFLQFIIRLEYENEGLGVFIQQFVTHAFLLNYQKIGAVPLGLPEDVLLAGSDRNREPPVPG